MVLSIKREILSQLKRIGLHFEKSMLRVMPPIASKPLNLNERTHQIGQTFYIDLPRETDSMFDTINNNMIKTLKSYSTLIQHVEVRSFNEDENESKNQLLLEVDFEYLVKELFHEFRQNLTRLFARYRRLDETEIDSESYNQKIIVEYSSPNIAKPFHVGNLRSTIIGNSVANILKFKGHQVLRMNYLGDWGTQFGILSLAFDQFGDEEKLQENPMKHLFDCYVRGHQEIELNEKWKDLAKERCHLLELHNDSKTLEQWNRFRELTFSELERLYKRLGITFDVYSSESMYHSSAQNVVEILKELSLIKLIDGAVYADIQNYNNPSQRIEVPLLKQDGTSLYLTRDIAAVLHRKKQFSFDRMYYVVDSSQAKHFNNLKSVFFSMGDQIYQEIRHLKFGRILGMSTRKGESIFLNDVLDEAKNRALDAIKSSPNTKITPEMYEQVADVLGVAAIIIHDLANRRVSEYKFNWNRALKLNGNTGISLQYTHARLCSLIKNCGHELNLECETNIKAIDTKDGRILINLLLMFDEIINSSYDQLEPSIIANYLFELKTAINRCIQEFSIKGQNDDNIIQTRLLLFICSKNVLNQCMKLLGLWPLESM